MRANLPFLRISRPRFSPTRQKKRDPISKDKNRNFSLLDERGALAKKEPPFEEKRETERETLEKKWEREGRAGEHLVPNPFWKTSQTHERESYTHDA